MRKAVEKRFVALNPTYFRRVNGELVALPQATIPFHTAHGHIVFGHYYRLTVISGPPNESERLSQPLEKFSNSCFRTWIKGTCPAQNTSPHVASKSFQSRHQFQPAPLWFSPLCRALLKRHFCLAAFLVPPQQDLIWLFIELCPVFIIQGIHKIYVYTFSLVVLWVTRMIILTCPSLCGATCQLKGSQ